MSDNPLSVALLPLRLPSASDDIARMLSSWLDASPRTTDLTAAECQPDLLRLQDLRTRIARGIPANDDYEAALRVQTEHQEYHCCLEECESRGMLTDKDQTQLSDSDNNQLHVRLHWQSAGVVHGTSADVAGLDVNASLSWERWNVLWNLAVLQTYQATQQKLDSKPGWSKAASHLQNAATLVRAMHTQLQQQQHQQQQILLQQQQSDLQISFLRFWQAVLVALSQRCVYESLACARKPRHLLLAKIAAAAVPLFHDCEQLSAGNDLDLAVGTSQVIRSWSDQVRAWGMYMSSCAEHHQACIHHDRQQNGLEIARLDLAIRYATLCMEFCETNVSHTLLSLQQAVDKHTEDLQQRYQQAMQDYEDRKNAEDAEGRKKSKIDPIPPRSELPEIRGEMLVKVDQPLEKLLGNGPNALLERPMFVNILSPNVRHYIDLFNIEIEKYFFQISGIAEERTEGARKALASAHLPHSLTAYRQEQAGGGIPDELWERVHTIQQTKKLQQLKSDLWELRDIAEQARMTFQKIKQQLDFDLDSDRLFRQQNPNFEGHDATQVQKTFRTSLDNYDGLLATANEGDQVLLRRLEIIDTNPKYKLLQFPKAQLDRLLPGASTYHPNRSPPIDTSHLSRLLVELSTLFHERDVLLSSLKDAIANTNIQTQLASVNPSSPDAEQNYHAVIRIVQDNVQKGDIANNLERNLDMQDDLLQKILVENERFQCARQETGGYGADGPVPNGSNPNSPASASDSCIAMIEDAMDEIEQLTKHLKEGKDFYANVIPKLEKLKQQVGDVSARLTVERCEYDDRVNRSRQEEEDAEFAKRMSENPAPRPPPQPQNGPQVDDEKVATLVGMEFDPAKVVAALAKHDNNMDAALNELLMG